MNEEQRAVLAAVGRMEQGNGALIDEYTVAREAGIVRGDLPSQEYVHSQARTQIRRLLEELELGGMIRLSREGYWRPRTTLAGRRAWQNPEAALLPPAVVSAGAPPLGRTAPAPIPSIFGDDDDDLPGPTPRSAPRQQAEQDDDAPPGWPGWWPAALRFGDPGLTPLIGSAAAGLVALLLVIFVASRVVGGGRVTPTPTISAVEQTATVFAALPTATQAVAGGSSQPSAGASASRTTGASTRPSAAPTATQPRQPTATAGPQTARVRIANTELQGAFLYATPAGERTKEAIPEGIVVETAGPDERDTQGRNWKHVKWGNGTYWLLEEYTEPVE